MSREDLISLKVFKKKKSFGERKPPKDFLYYFLAEKYGWTPEQVKRQSNKIIANIIKYNNILGDGK